VERRRERGEADVARTERGRESGAREEDYVDWFSPPAQKISILTKFPDPR